MSANGPARAFPRAILLVMMLLLVAPAQAQLSNPEQSTPTTLYFHIFDTFNKFVINTQPMNADFFDVGGTNNPTVDGTPVNTVIDQAPVARGPWDLNTIYGTSTAGPVEYDFIENGQPRFHPESGIAADVKLDTTVQPTAYMYLDLRDFLGKDGLPTAVPDFALEVTMRTGDDPGRHAQLDEGQLILHGKRTFHLVDAPIRPGDDANALVYWATWMTVGGVDPGLPEDGTDANAVTSAAAGETPDGATLVVPDADGVVELPVPLTIENDGVIPKSEAFNIRLDWYQLEQAFGPDAFATGAIRMHASPDKQPRLDMAILNPIYVEFLHPQVAAGTLLIHSGVNSPWGTYDVDAENIQVRVDGPSAPQRLDRVVSQNQHVHGLHDKAAEVTYLWNFRDEGAANGDYTIHLEVPNMAHTAVAKADAGFTIEGKKAFGVSDQGEVVQATLDEANQDSPAVGPALLGLALAALALARRRSL